jgi:hypothetical protein
MANTGLQPIPDEEWVGAHGEGQDVAVDVTGSALDDPNQPVLVWNEELDATNTVPRFALVQLWSQRGWVEITDPHDPKGSVVSSEDGAPPEDESVPPEEQDAAVPPEAPAKGRSHKTGAASAADKE